MWLTKIFAGIDVTTTDQAQQVFLRYENDPRAISFAALLVWNKDELHRAADLGYAFAQARAVWQIVDKKERFRYAQKSAAQGERDGFFTVGFCYLYGHGCDEDREKAREYLLIAAELGYINAMICISRLIDPDDPKRIFWLGKAATSKTNSCQPFVNEIYNEIVSFKSGIGNTKIVFAIGRVLKGQIGTHKIFGERYSSSDTIALANEAVQFYDFQLQMYRKAVDCWTHISLKINVVKDIRKMIANLIWDSRHEAAYKNK